MTASFHILPNLPFKIIPGSSREFRVSISVRSISTPGKCLFVYNMRLENPVYSNVSGYNQKKRVFLLSFPEVTRIPMAPRCWSPISSGMVCDDLCPLMPALDKSRIHL